ncbi:MAG: cadmium resistance transporter [Verrucomicrobia bacterium]|nr:cadmium resistance transporter [Verrucomicrobiota bacterium]
MDSLPGLLGLAVVVFVSTNFDDVFLLLGFFSDRALRTKTIVLGQLLGIGALYAVSIAGALAALVIPRAYVGLLGLLPVIIGVVKLVQAWRDNNNRAESVGPKKVAGVRGLFSVAAVTIANGGDNIGVYTPLFATSTKAEIVVYGVVFGLMTGVLCLAARWLVNHWVLGAPIRAYGPRVFPLVLIALGVWILYRTGSIELIRSWVTPS